MNYLSFKNKRSELIFFNIVLFLFFLSSSIKRTESFYDAGERIYSNLISFFANNYQVFAFIAVFMVFIKIFIKVINGGKFKNLGVGLIAFLFIKFYAIIINSFYESFSLNILFSFVLILLFSFLFVKLSTEIKDFPDRICDSISLFSVLFLALNVYEILINPSGAIWGGRLYGVTNHPNFVGGYCAVMMPFVLRSILITTKKIKFVFLMTFIGLLALIFFSGSRSSLLAVSLGSLVWAWLSLGAKKSLIISTLFILFLILYFVNISSFSSELGFNVNRLFLTENTRAEVNSILFSAFLENPILGNPVKSGATSNSYLSILARMGIVGGIFLLIIIFASIKKSISDIRRLGAGSSDYACAGALLSIFIYSLFEGVLVENFSLGQGIFFLCLVILRVSGSKKRYEYINITTISNKLQS